MLSAEISAGSLFEDGLRWEARAEGNGSRGGAANADRFAGESVAPACRGLFGVPPTSPAEGAEDGGPAWGDWAEIGAAGAVAVGTPSAKIGGACGAAEASAGVVAISTDAETIL